MFSNHYANHWRIQDFMLGGAKNESEKQKKKSSGSKIWGKLNFFRLFLQNVKILQIYFVLCKLNFEEMTRKNIIFPKFLNQD